MYRTIIIATMIMSGLQSATAQECAQEVLRDLYADLEKVDIVGEERLARSLDKLSKQEGWSEKERGDYTLAIADTKADWRSAATRTVWRCEIYVRGRSSWSRRNGTPRFSKWNRRSGTRRGSARAYRSTRRSRRRSRPLCVDNCRCAADRNGVRGSRDRGALARARPRYGFGVS